MEELLEKYPYMASFVGGDGVAGQQFTRSDAVADPLNTYLQQLAGPLRSCSRQTTVRDAARLLLESGAEALAVTGEGGAFDGVVTAKTLLAWIADGGADAGRPGVGRRRHASRVRRA